MPVGGHPADRLLAHSCLIAKSGLQRSVSVNVSVPERHSAGQNLRSAMFLLRPSSVSLIS